MAVNGQPDAIAGFVISVTKREFPHLHARFFSSRHHLGSQVTGALLSLSTFRPIYTIRPQRIE